MKTIVIASNNVGKISEFGSLLKPLGFAVASQSNLDVTEVPETGTTFVENAIIKARNCCAQTGLPAIADDSGIEVDYLSGAPGIYSARFAGDQCDDQANNDKLLDALRGVPEKLRTARYQCLLVYMRHEKDPTPLICHGVWEGRILESPVGEGGFGYDPLFFCPEHNLSSAQLSAQQKAQVSHRGKALRLLMAQVGDHLSRLASQPVSG